METSARQDFYEKYLTEAELFDFTFREHGSLVHPLAVRLDLSRQHLRIQKKAHEASAAVTFTIWPTRVSDATWIRHGWLQSWNGVHGRSEALLISETRSLVIVRR